MFKRLLLSLRRNKQSFNRKKLNFYLQKRNFLLKIRALINKLLAFLRHQRNRQRSWILKRSTRLTSKMKKENMNMRTKMMNRKKISETNESLFIS